MKAYTTHTMLLAILALAGCREAPETNPDSAELGPRVVPIKMTDARVEKGRVICPLEVVNGNPVRDTRTFPAGSKATLVGWSRVADRQRPVPPLVHAVFRSTVPDGSADLFWPGVRVARPDIALTDSRMAMSGYSVSGRLPENPGRYRVLIWVGDTGLQRECDTGEVFTLHG